MIDQSLYSTSLVPAGTCLLHGPHGLTFCPTCSTCALVPGINIIAPIPLPYIPERQAGKQ